MRSSLLLVLSVSGCFGAGGVDYQYTLFADDAAVGDVDHDGQPWCAGGAAPMVSVAATLAGITSETSEQAGLTPSWREALVDADLASYRRGVAVDVRGHCDGASFHIGRALVHPDAAMVQSRGVALGPIGNVTRLRLHFEMADAGAVGDTVDPAFAYGDDDYAWYDPSPAADDPGYDWGDAPPDPGGDGSGDYGGDPGGDYGGDPGGDYGGDAGGFRRRVRTQTTRIMAAPTSRRR